MSRNNNNNQGNYYGNNYNNPNGNYYNGNNRNNRNNQYNRQNGNQQRQYYNQNQQYNNQYYSGQNSNRQQQYNQQNNMPSYYPQNNDSQKEKKNYTPLILRIGIGVIGVLFIILVVLLLKGCGKKAELFDGESKRVGDTTYGYVTIPNDWMNFSDIEATSGIRFSDKDTKYVVTLNISNSYSPKEFAEKAKEQLGEVDVSDIEIVEEKFNKKDAYKLTGNKDKETWILIYFFKDEDNVTHFVGIEGIDKNTDYFKIPTTYELKK